MIVIDNVINNNIDFTGSENAEIDFRTISGKSNYENCCFKDVSVINSDGYEMIIPEDGMVYKLLDSELDDFMKLFLKKD